MEEVGGCGALGSGVGASEEVGADATGWVEQRGVQDAAVEGAGRGRRWPGWRMEERSYQSCLRETPPF